MTIFEYLLQVDKDGRRAQLLHQVLHALGLKIIRVPYGKRFEVVQDS